MTPSPASTSGRAPRRLPSNRYLSEVSIISELHYLRRGKSCAPFLLQVPWGKHNPIDFRGRHFAQMSERVDVDEVLPVVVVKDPLTWMKSMCRMEYAAKFRHGQAQCCPHPIAKTRTDVRFRKEFPARNYSSLPGLWRDWNGDYQAWAAPRLVVRYEDLLWRSRATTEKICACVGGTVAADFNPIALSAKGGAGHGFHETGRNSATARYGNETRRYEMLADADVDFVNGEIGAAALARHHYGLSNDRRRAALGRAPPCKPKRVEWLKSVGLKPGATGPVPLDDESDGVLVNGMFYPNPKKKASGPAGSRIKHAVAKAQEALRAA